MQSEERDVLKEARYAAQELRSLDETLKTVEGRLYAIPGARTHGTSAGVVDPDYKERLMDRHGEFKEKLSVARIRVSAALLKAEEIIESVEHPRIRTALRYYYICRKKPKDIADLLECDERSVKRWIYGK